MLVALATVSVAISSPVPSHNSGLRGWFLYDNMACKIFIDQCKFSEVTSKNFQSKAP